MSEEETKTTYTEEFKVSGAGLVDEVKKLIHEGNVQHIMIKNDAGITVFEMPLAVGVIGLALLPVLAAIGAIVVLASNYTISVTRVAP
jgi:hypothetical protein